ncbi:integrase core domain protein [Synechococcus sp. RS9909]|uniref:DDE-type integrase/transposase/recombinase n=1 Tax=unclassified Synechococcus TaxID=2626047 RepID=UPI000068F8A2|nr:putative transposase [Synechococcus sp. RS9917]QNI79655.1 integrase core domain protein [Synechococcus sp. RS9909]
MARSGFYAWRRIWSRGELAAAGLRCWAGDITYIRTTAGWRYLAVWIDLFSRRVVGWTLAPRMDATLVIEALNRALGQRHLEPEQLQRDLAFWIEGYYNRERRHSTIDYLSPIDYEQQFITARTFSPVNP